MSRMNSIHRSMIAPLVAMQLFIASDYWFDFTGAPWAIHVHVLSLTAWYVFLITQPYFISTGNIEKHRTYGMIGLAIGGSVAVTGISMLPNTVGFGRFVEANPGGIGQFEPEFFYGVAITELILAVLVLFALAKAILLRKSRNDHAAWLISTAFIMLFPAIGRGVQNLFIALNGMDEENFHLLIIALPMIVSASIIIGLTVFVAARHSMLRHPAIVLAILANLVPPILLIFPGLVEPFAEPIKQILSLRFAGTRF
ncbi:MAG: hypothetical protein V2J10_04720 [Wenzhouxiangella sp.]|nr:hypothetical protein [Wenzhouxiangella sp.]